MRVTQVTKLIFIVEIEKLVKKKCGAFFEKPPHAPKNLIGWFEQSLRKFSIIQE